MLQKFTSRPKLPHGQLAASCEITYQLIVVGELQENVKWMVTE